MKRICILYSLTFLTFLCRSQIEIKPTKGDCDEFKKLRKVEFTSVEAECTDSPLKILLINSKEEMKSFSLNHKLTISECQNTTTDFDFNAYSILFIGVGIGGNEKLLVDFYLKENSLNIVLVVIGPENVDFSLNTQLKYFLVDKKYTSALPVLVTCHKRL